MTRKSALHAELSHKLLENALTTFLERNVGEKLSIDQIIEQINQDQTTPITSNQVIPFMQQFLKPMFLKKLNLCLLMFVILILS